MILASSSVCVTLQREDDIPLVEWWDADILPSRAYADCDRQLPLEQKYREITNLIEHPLPVQPAGNNIYVLCFHIIKPQTVLSLTYMGIIDRCSFKANSSSSHVN